MLNFQSLNFQELNLQTLNFQHLNFQSLKLPNVYFHNFNIELWTLTTPKFEQTLNFQSWTFKRRTKEEKKEEIQKKKKRRTKEETKKKRRRKEEKTEESLRKILFYNQKCCLHVKKQLSASSDWPCNAPAWEKKEEKTKPKFVDLFFRFLAGVLTTFSGAKMVTNRFWLLLWT